MLGGSREPSLGFGPLKTQVDLQTLLGFLSATGLPAVFKAVISFLHPSLYTLTCGVAWTDSSAKNCYADDRLEALLWLGLTLIAVAYGAFTLWRKLLNTPVATNTITVRDADTGLKTTIATVNAPGVTTPPTAASTKGTT